MLRPVLMATLLLASSGAWADTLSLPAPALERTGPAVASYRADPPAGGQGTLDVEWTDNLGRQMLRERIAVELHPGDAIPIPLDIRRARAMRNTLRARLTLPGHDGSAELGFIAMPPPAAWDDYQILMWHDAAPPRAASLRALGITGGKVLGIREAFTQADVDKRIAPLLDGELRWFVENIATDFYAPYHRWTPEHPDAVNWKFTEAQRLHKQDPADTSVFRREPSLSDPAWIARITERLAQTVHAHAPYRPLYYNLGDETGIADLTAAWDFDFSPVSLAAFRDWLRPQYGSLGALNRQWGTDFATWDEVVPQGTTSAMAREDSNFSAWSDFKAFMDAAFARALAAGTRAVRAADPTALAAIEGAQIPGWGGYDYSRLAHAVDAIEISGAGHNIEIIRALNPRIVALSTASGGGDADRHGIWEMLLRGTRGLVLWDDSGAIVDAAGQTGPSGQALAPLFAELRGGLAAQIMASRPFTDGVAILYSPASFRIQWLLDQRGQRDAWTMRGSEAENEDNAVRAALRRAAFATARMGLQPRYVSSEGVERGVLRDGDLRALILPHAIALSDAEAAEIRAFVASGGVVIADGMPGRFDGHGRQLPAPALQGMAMVSLAGPLTLGDFARPLEKAGLAPGFAVTAAGGTPAPDVDSYVFTNGGVTLLGLQRGAGGEAGDILVHLPMPLFVRDLRKPGDWLRTDRITIPLDSVSPVLLALAPAVLVDPAMILPAQARAGETVTLQVALAGRSLAAARVLAITAIDPSGQEAAAYSGNVVARGSDVSWPIPLAMNDKTGEWIIRVRDVLGGGSVAAKLTVLPP
jgi:hypothetical protein